MSHGVGCHGCSHDHRPRRPQRARHRHYRRWQQGLRAGADLQSAKAFTTDYSEPHGHLAQVLRVAKASTVPLIARVGGACMA